MTQYDVMVSFFENGIVPASEIMWMVVILIIGAIALWQARVFVHKF
jgi:hypothetical protein